MNWKMIDHAAFSQPNIAPKTTSITQFPAKICPQIVLPVRFDTMSDMKSLPAVEAPPLSASAIEKP